MVVANVRQALDKNTLNAPNCPFRGPRRQIAEWKILGADPVLQNAILKGANAPLHNIPPPKTTWEEPANSPLMTTIGEYCKNGALRPLTVEEQNRTKHWTPVFGRPKKDSPKLRLITDLRALNCCFELRKHRAQTWEQVLAMLENPQNQWGLTLDLKSFFHHLEMHPKLQRWMRFRAGGRRFRL